MANGKLNTIATIIALAIGITSLIFAIVLGINHLSRLEAVSEGLRQVSDINITVGAGLAGVIDHLVLLDADQATDCLMGEGGVAYITRWCKFAHAKGLVTTVASSPRRYEPTQKGKDLIQGLDPNLVTELLTRANDRPDDPTPQHLASLNLGVLNRTLLEYKTEHADCMATLKDVLAVLAAYLSFPAPG